MWITPRRSEASERVGLWRTVRSRIASKLGKTSGPLTKAAMGAATLIGRVAEPEDMAHFVCALADPKITGYATGQVFPINGGLYLA